MVEYKAKTAKQKNKKTKILEWSLDLAEIIVKIWSKEFIWLLQKQNVIKDGMIMIKSIYSIISIIWI